MFHSDVFGQDNEGALQVNTITTAVPFLLISPDARGGALGEAGVGTSPDQNNTHWNPAKWAFIDDESGISISYTPWLRNLVNDMGIMYVSGYYKLNKRTTIAGDLKYFSLGNITFTDQNGNDIKDHKPYEFALDGAVGTKLSEKFSGGVAARFIYSNLTDGLGDTKKAASSGSVDVSSYFHDDINIFGQDAEIGVGVNVSNIGAKMSYSTVTAEKDFIPTNLKIGQATKLLLDEYNSLTIITDFNKLLVPTPQYDSDGKRVYPNVGVASGMFQSFGDAPRGFQEELEEISISFGAEYMYNDLIGFRGGYFYEHPNKGNRQYFTAGFGLKLNVWCIDASYLIASKNNPLANTFRFTLSFSFDAFKEQQKDVEDE
jgi:hypothetical protein